MGRTNASPGNRNVSTYLLKDRDRGVEVNDTTNTHANDELVIEDDGPVRILRINRPGSLGAFTWSMIDKWADALVAAQWDSGVRVVVLTGTGRGFCSGVDLAELDAVGNSPIDRKRMLTQRVHKVARAVDDLEKPLLCAVNGTAVGAGMDMALMCDIRIAAKSAKFSEGYIHLGLVPGDGGSYYLPRLVGIAKALELLWTGDTLTADEALAAGIVSKVVPDEQLTDAVLELAHRVAKKSPIAVSMVKRHAYQSLRMDLRTSLDLISSHMGIVQSTEAEAMAAFRERRAPLFIDH
jgi:enoyl-CoA hydratase/carnithine racemase